jgi:Double zinc ribbon
MTANPVDAALTCPACGEPIEVGDSFCEACGTELTPPAISADVPGFSPACPVCSVDPLVAASATTSPEGYGESCGRKLPSGSEHVELDLGLLAGVTDRGLRHSRGMDNVTVVLAPFTPIRAETSSRRAAQ